MIEIKLNYIYYSLYELNYIFLVGLIILFCHHRLVFLYITIEHKRKKKYSIAFMHSNIEQI
jgi:hypothetical protein